MQGIYRLLFTDSQAKVSFTSQLHTFVIAMQYTVQKVPFVDFANAKSLIMSSKSTERSMSGGQCRVETRVQSLLIHHCSVRVLDSPEYSVQALMVNVALYCLLCIVLQHSNIYGTPME